MDTLQVTAKLVLSEMLPSLLAEPHLTPSEFAAKGWATYKSAYAGNPNLNGRVFEELIAVSLARAGITPIYTQAFVTHIPGVKYDCIAYTDDIGPISISAKTSLRERWK